MKNYLNLKLAHFCNNQQLEGGRYLVAVSCGVDSMVLLHGLAGLKEKFSFELAVVHVHHQWRQESDQEYTFLEQYTQSLGLRFYGTRLPKQEEQNDLENRARRARYSFFKQVYDSFGAQGLFLAHQKQDVEETVMKRIVEGAHLTHLGGMKERSVQQGMVLWRPFLSVNKKDIVQVAQNEKVPYFEDRTNIDPKFLRSRLREQFFPCLEQVFDKKIKDNLLQLSQSSWALQDYFETQFQLKVHFGRLRTDVVSLHVDSNAHPFELENYILIFFQKFQLKLPRAILKRVVVALQGSKNVKWFETKMVKLGVSQGFCIMSSATLSQVALDPFFSGIRLPIWVEEFFCCSNLVLNDSICGTNCN
jgi:tRNA(Ile)-lysidine synthetase-like protein